MQRSALDPRRAGLHLGWKPWTPLGNGVAAVVDHVRRAAFVIAVLCGGVGAARMLAGLQAVVDPGEIVAVVNTGDDTELHGLYVSPDLDTITYTLAGVVNPATGWGLDGRDLSRHAGPGALRRHHLVPSR